LRRGAAVLAAAAVVAALLLAPSASGSRYLETGFFDDAQILYGNPDKLFPTLRTLNTQVIRVNLIWGGPNGVATRRPANASNPSDPAYDWATYDRTVFFAATYGIRAERAKETIEITSLGPEEASAIAGGMAAAVLFIGRKGVRGLVRIFWRGSDRR